MMFEYNQDDFTENNYSKILDLAKEYYRFERFSKKNKIPDYPVVLWRHDVDISVHRALKLAQIEKDKGLISTFFFQLGSGFYNVFDNEIKVRIKEISSLGHSIGLHFDPTVYEIKSRASLIDKLLFEKEILEKLLEEPIKTFSFHNPTAETLSIDDHVLAGMVNAYSRFYKKKYGYCSDSNGYWRFDRLEDVLLKQEHKFLQVLTHPEWWQINIADPRQRIQRCVEGRAKFVLKNYDDVLEKFARKNIGK